MSTSEKAKPEDLSSLLDLNLGPSWSSGDSGELQKMADRDGGRDSRRGEKFSRNARKGGGGKFSSHERRDRGDRKFKGKGKPGNRGGDDRRGEPRREEMFEPVVDVTVQPKKDFFGALVAKMKSTCRTYEVFDIAQVVLKNLDEAEIRVKVKSDSKQYGLVYLSLIDGVPFLSEDEVYEHVLKNHLKEFFTTQESEVEAPKGNFTCVNRCGITGDLIGPPNYHRYRELLREHQASKLSNVSLERIGGKIESVRDEEVIQQWLEGMKKQIHYVVNVEAPQVPENDSSEVNAENATGDEKQSEAEGGSDVVSEKVEEAKTEEVESSEGVIDSSEDTSVKEEGEDDTQATEGGEENGENDAVEAAEAVGAEVLSFATREAAKAYLKEKKHHVIVRTMKSARFSGAQYKEMPKGDLWRSIQVTLQKQKRFPLDTSHFIREELRRKHFSVFKRGSKGVTYACAVKRKRRAGDSVFGSHLQELMNFLEKHPYGVKSDLIKEYLSLSSTHVDEMSEEEKQKVSKFLTDLHWLVSEGYVTEYDDGRLYLPEVESNSSKKNVSSQQPAKAQAEKKKASDKGGEADASSEVDTKEKSFEKETAEDSAEKSSDAEKASAKEGEEEEPSKVEAVENSSETVKTEEVVEG